MKTTAPVLIVLAILVLFGIVGIQRGFRFQPATEKSEGAQTLLGLPSLATSPTGASDEQPSGYTQKKLSLTITSPKNGATVTSSTVTVTGKTVPAGEVSINDTETMADASGNFSALVTLDEGENNIVVVANDAEGNFAEVELTVTYDSGQ